jgi:FkbM family methyltransferase
MNSALQRASWRPAIGPILKARARCVRERGSRDAVYDLQTLRIMKRTLRPDSVCVDVGFGRGKLLRPMLRWAPRGRVYGFEPRPAAFAALWRELGAHPAARLSSLALSDEAGERAFNHVITRPSYSGFRRRRYDRPERDEQIRVRTARLDDRIAPAERVAFVKIDVEGAELQVLRGARRTIARHQPVIVFEHGLGSADVYGTRPDQVFELLVGECGLAVSLLDGFLRDAAPLPRAEFRRQFDDDVNYCFVAHPARSR